MKKLVYCLGFLIGCAPALVFAQTATELGEVDDFGDLVGKIWGWGFPIVLALSVAMIIVGGFMYMASGGSGEKVEQAKEIINGSLISTGIVLCSAVIQKLLTQSTQGLKKGATASLTQVPDAIKNTTNIMLSFVGGFAVLMIIYSTYRYITAMGDSEKVEHAKKGLSYAIIGFLITLLAYFIMNTFVNVVGK